MKNALGQFRKIFATVLVLSILVSSVNFSCVALPVSDEYNGQLIENEDSTFVLSSSNVQSGDDEYYPETANPESEYSAINNTNKAKMLTATVGDPMVYLTQKWLNQNYGNVSGFGTVTENGKTGWNVVYGLTRALQHELGITSLADNFGPSTQSLYNQAPLHKQSGHDNKYAILQGALWCKGYNPGYKLSEDANGIVHFDDVFDDDVEDAVIQLKEDAGLINPNGTVTTNFMKALLSMDSFKLLGSYYGGRTEVREMQQRFNRNYENYTGINPCDGVYGRNTNKALIKVFQANEGLSVSDATGNFGPTTKALAPDIPYSATGNAKRNYQGQYYTTSNIREFIEILQFALFINGFGDGNFNGVFSSRTQKDVRDFQQHYALPVTGKVDITTWMSLLISSGNPDRNAKAADCATILNAAKAQILYNNGYRYIGRYLTGTYGGGISKALTIEEANIILNAGLRFFPIYQTSANSESYFTPSKGTSDAIAAITAANNLGLPKDTIIYFAVDFDAMDYQITDSVIPYFKKVYDEVKTSGFKVGIYGARNVCSRVSDAGYACSSFVGDMSTGFSGNLGFKIPDNWAFSQFANLEGSNALGSGEGRIEIDKDAFSGRDQGVGKLNKVVKKAIYILPGYMGSKLYKSNGDLFWVDGTTENYLSFVSTPNLGLLEDMAKNALNRHSSIGVLNEDGSGSKLHADPLNDEYGAINLYENVITRLEDEFENEYDIKFFPYNWLGDLNDSTKKLQNNIKENGYTNVVLVAHSCGGLLASSFIAQNNKSSNKVKVDKAILVGAPLYGTYSALAPLETGVGAFLNDKYQLTNAFVNAAKHGVIPYTSISELINRLSATSVYDAANNWVKDVSKNSPTTYQLLPSKEYLKLMPQIHKSEFNNGTAVTTMNQYYEILNGSTNINTNLTNGNSHSHKYFRETILKDDIVSVLQTVDTFIIASQNSKAKTPVIAKYTNKLLGGTKLSEIVYMNDGDGTVQYNSATANDGSGEKFKVYLKKDVSHRNLISNIDVIKKIINEIKGIKSTNESDLLYYSDTNSIGMENLLKINYSSDVLINAKIVDIENEMVAEISSDGISGFDGENFIYYSYADNSNVSDATIYMPNAGYKLIFNYGETAGNSVNFEEEVSTLNEEGWKDVSVNKTVLQTTIDGVIEIIDGTSNTIDSSNISSIINGSVESHYTNWELPETVNIEFGTSESSLLTGNDSSIVSSLIEWSSSDEQVVTISTTGVITAVGYGKATISATDGNKTCICDVVVPQNASSVELSNMYLSVNDRVPLKPVFTPITATNTELIYTYNTESIVSIDEFGVLTALSEGTVTVTATTDYGVSASFAVTVTDPDFSPKIGDINLDESVNLIDLVRFKKHFAGMIMLSSQELFAAEINKDGIIDSQDLIGLVRILLEID